MTAAPDAYHSALTAGKEQDAPPMNGPVIFPKATVFRWNVCTEAVPEFYLDCDVLYMEPPWPTGLAVFDRRAGDSTPSYSDLMLRIEEVVMTLGLPAVAPCSKAGLKLFRHMDYVTECNLHGGPVPLVVWNGAKVSGFTNFDVLRNLATTYECAGDCFCGYGATGRAFAAAGKRSILSDHNPKCVGYIAENAVAWGFT